VVGIGGWLNGGLFFYANKNEKKLNN